MKPPSEKEIEVAYEADVVWVETSQKEWIPSSPHRPCIVGVVFELCLAEEYHGSYLPQQRAYLAHIAPLDFKPVPTCFQLHATPLHMFGKFGVSIERKSEYHHEYFIR